LFAGRQLHAGRSDFLLQYDWWPAGRVSSASVLIRVPPTLVHDGNPVIDSSRGARYDPCRREAHQV
jgi:hypothetical protein